jgi:hypothetical protein
MSTKRIHVLRQPMLIRTNNPDKPYYLLPAGTALYFDASMPEGFDRYYVYMNTRAQLRTAPAEKPGLIDPIWIDPIDRGTVAKLLRDYPLSKDDLAAILRAQKLQRADIEQILREWKDD